jgi:hypothetical protein
MKTENKTVISSVIENEKLIETKETIAEELTQDLNQGKARLFSAGEMWQLRKNFRSASVKRYMN